MKKSRKVLLVFASLIIMASAFALLVYQPSVIARIPFSAPETSFHNWDEFFSSPKPITIRTYSTGIMQTDLSGIMNLAHGQAADIEDVVIKIPVNASIIHHQEFGAYLIDAGLDASYVNNPYGTSG
jgi:N-acyl homoserine lactone hydrolase